MLKHGKRKGSKKCGKTKNNKVIEGLSTLEISKKLCRDHTMINTTVKIITKFQTWIKGKGFKNLLPWNECKIKWVTAKQPLLTSTQIFQKGWNWQSQERQKL